MGAIVSILKGAVGTYGETRYAASNFNAVKLAGWKLQATGGKVFVRS